MSAWNQLKNSVLSTQRIREVDCLAVEEYGMHSLVLMENAALGCVRWIESQFSAPGRVAILCGRGNNGGDGLAIARHLRLLGWETEVWMLGPRERMSADARANFDILCAHSEHLPKLITDGQAEDLEAIQAADLILDAMLGTGAAGPPRSPFDSWIAAANQSNAMRVAIDMPTGVDAESAARCEPAFRPAATLTFVARKPAMVSEAASELFGAIEVLPIGIPEPLIRRLLQRDVRETCGD